MLKLFFFCHIERVLGDENLQIHTSLFQPQLEPKEEIIRPICIFCDTVLSIRAQKR